MDSDPVRRQGPERDKAEGEVVLGASPPARHLPQANGGPFGCYPAARAKPARPPWSAAQALPSRPAIAAGKWRAFGSYPAARAKPARPPWSAAQALPSPFGSYPAARAKPARPPWSAAQARPSRPALQGRG